MNEIQQKIESLRTDLRKWDNLYYVLDTPEASDSQYDQEMNELKGKLINE